MKRRLIFSLVTLLLALNLAIGAKIYFSPRTRPMQKIRRTRTWNVLPTCWKKSARVMWTAPT